MKNVIVTSEAPAALGPYSQGVAVGNMVFCAGQLPLSASTGELVGGDVAAETARVLENLGAVLRAEGLSYTHVVKTTVYLTDLKDFDAMNTVYALYFSSEPPARSTVQVAGLPKQARVEIEAIAWRETTPVSPRTLNAPVDYAPASPL